MNLFKSSSSHRNRNTVLVFIVSGMWNLNLFSLMTFLYCHLTIWFPQIPAIISNQTVTIRF